VRPDVFKDIHDGTSETEAILPNNRGTAQAIQGSSVLPFLPALHPHTPHTRHSALVSERRSQSHTELEKSTESTAKGAAHKAVCNE